MRLRHAVAVALGGVCLSFGTATAQPIALHPDNGHYFLFRGQPTVLVTSGEHYGAVMNLDFDYVTYFDTLKADGLNLTRTFSGMYVESWGSPWNTLNCEPNRYVTPWARSSTPGYAEGGNKFDLTQWDPAYFSRLRDFVSQAGQRGVVVELVLFCVSYSDGNWSLSPLNSSNNVNGIGQSGRHGVFNLGDQAMTDVLDAMVRKIVTELSDLDNVYFEICNEPYCDSGPDQAWHDHMISTIRSVNTTHLIAQNISNGSSKISSPNPQVSVFNFHYATPPDCVGVNYGLNKVIADDETGFDGTGAVNYRGEAWDFIIAGGAVFDNLDWSFTPYAEDGTSTDASDHLGGGSPTLREQLGILKDFMHGFDFVRMTPQNSVIKGGVPGGATARALVEEGEAYAIYVRGGTGANLQVELPAGQYTADWVNTKTGNVDKTEDFDHAGGTRTLASPAYSEDIALRIGDSSGIPPQESITVTAPTGGSYHGKQDATITWTSRNLPGNVRIEFTSDGWTGSTVVAGSTADDGSHVWELPNTGSTNCAFRVSDATDGDPAAVSGTFSIEAITDQDGDRMDDAWETGYWGDIATSDGTGDTDGDGPTDLEEFWKGTDPTAAAGGLVGHWKFDETSGSTAADSSPSANHGTVHGAIWTQGTVDGALSFDGADTDYVEIPNESDYDLAEAVSYAVWIKADPSSATSWAGIVTKGDNLNLQRYNVESHAVWQTEAGTITDYQLQGKTNVFDGEWHHIAVTYDGSQKCIYADGSLDNSAAATGTIDTADVPVMIGKNGQVAGHAFDGLIDDVRIYDYALDVSEVQALYEMGSGGPPSQDQDGDGLPDAWELHYGLDPTEKDSDSDGTPDPEEDPDGDGYTNLQEFQSGTDPTNANSAPDGGGDGAGTSGCLPVWQTGGTLATGHPALGAALLLVALALVGLRRTK